MNLEDMINPELKSFMSNGETDESYSQLIFRFPNDYGASVITGYGTGIELAKILFYDAPSDEVDYILLGEEPVRYLERDELNYILNSIKEGTK